MSVLIYLMLTKIMITISCAPKLGHIIYDTLNLDSTKLENETKSIKDINATADVREENKKNHNIIPHKEGIMEAINETNTTQSNKDFLSNVESEVIELDNGLANPTTEAQTLFILSQENDILDTDESLDWIDPESAASEIPKSNRTIKRTLQKKKECHTCADAVQSTIVNEKKSEKEQFLLERSVIKPLFNDKIKTETSKREIPTPHNFFIKILRSVSGIPQEDLKGEEIIIDGYDYNINICRYIGQRYLCGYNKNIGEINDSVEIEELDNGCIIRGDRMECGYKVRPWNVLHNKSKLSLKYVKGGNGDGNETSPNKQPTQSAMVANPAVSPGLKPDTLVSSTILPDQIKANGNKACYEKDGRVVCYDVPT